MIGRTNVPQRKAPTINGDVKNFVVASGSAIEKGDFVSFKVQKSDNPMSASVDFVGYGHNWKVADNKYLYQDSNGLVKLVSVTDGMYNELASVTGVCFTLLSDGNVVVITSSSSMLLYSISGDVFSLIQTVALPFTVSLGFTNSTDNNIVTQLSGGEIVVVQSGSSGSHGKSYIYDYQNQVIDTNYSQFTLTSGLYYVKKVLSFSNGYYAVQTQPDNNNNAVALFRYYDGNHMSVGSTNYRTSKSSTQGITDVCCGNSDYFPVWCASQKEYNFYLMKFENNVVTNVGSVYEYSEIYSALGVSPYFYGSVFLNRNTVLFYASSSSTNKCVFFIGEINEGTSGVTLSNKVVFNLSGVRSVGNCLMDENGNLLCFWNDSSEKHLLKMNYAEGVLMEGFETEFVEPYNGTRNLGFAKTGGNAGDTIQVYVPHTSS